jgi:riboflavin kinase / FMN adenylyltransferase
MKAGVMQVWNGLETITRPFDASSVAIGRFDGVHLGHQALIRKAVEDAASMRQASVVFTFDRHPAELLAPDRAPGYLTTLPRRIELIGELGVGHLVVARFDERFRSLSSQTFLHFVLSGVLGARAVFVGPDFRFGMEQSGSVETLKEGEERYRYSTNVLAAVTAKGQPVSSSRIRELIRQGEVEAAAEMLGRPHTLEGTVAHGEKLGRTIGYPTANLEIAGNLVIPKDGIYAVRARLADRRQIGGACSIGLRPTVGGTARTVETYLLDFEGDLYGQRMEIAFIARLRDELKFEGLEPLKEQITRDVDETRKLLG